MKRPTAPKHPPPPHLWPKSGLPVVALPVLAPVLSKGVPPSHAFKRARVQSSSSSSDVVDASASCSLPDHADAVDAVGSASNDSGVAAADTHPLVPGCVDEVLGLLLYLVVRKDDQEICERLGSLPTRLAGGRGYVAFRQDRGAALARAARDAGCAASLCKETYVMLKVYFTPLGLAHFAALSAGPAHGYCSMLTRAIDSSAYAYIDWQEWHFHGALPLHLTEEVSGQPLLMAAWQMID